MVSCQLYALSVVPVLCFLGFCSVHVIDFLIFYLEYICFIASIFVIFVFIFVILPTTALEVERKTGSENETRRNKKISRCTKFVKTFIFI